MTEPSRSLIRRLCTAGWPLFMYTNRASSTNLAPKSPDRSHCLAGTPFPSPSPSRKSEEPQKQ